MSDKLGFTFYPKDWWSSDSFYDLTAAQRYIYLECLFLMYANGGYMKTQKTQLEKRIRENINDEDWQIVTERFIYDSSGFTHASVNKRCRQAAANRENGKKGGRPPKEEKPKEPILETENNPPLEREREREEKRKENIRFINKSLMSEIKISDDKHFLSVKDVSIEITDVELDYFKIAEAFRQMTINILTRHEIPTIHQVNAKYKAYIDPVRLMITSDKITPEQIKEACRFIKNSDNIFHRQNIQSTSSLRKNIIRVISDMKLKGSKTVKPQQGI